MQYNDELVLPFGNKQEKGEIDQVTLRKKINHIRQSSVGIVSSQYDDEFTDAHDHEDMSYSTRARRRSISWEPFGEFYIRDSMCLSETDRSMLSHQECKVFFRILRIYLY